MTAPEYKVYQLSRQCMVKNKTNSCSLALGCPCLLPETLSAHLIIFHSPLAAPCCVQRPGDHGVSAAHRRGSRFCFAVQRRPGELCASHPGAAPATRFGASRSFLQSYAGASDAGSDQGLWTGICMGSPPD